jgi:alpha-tubulin suppressor-like RCC1 family protein
VQDANSDWTQLSFRYQTVCGIRAGGQLFCMGKNAYGELGDPVLTNPSLLGFTLKRVGTDTDWVEVSAGYDHTCGVHANSTLACWGSRASYQLGDGLGPSLVPKAIDVGATYAQVDLGNDHACARKTDGSLWCWGANVYGSAGAPGSMMWAVPTRVGTDTSWTQVSAGGLASCAAKSDGTLWCWGYNTSGQVGDGTNANRNVPTQVLTQPLLAATDWMDVTVGVSDACARRANGAPATPSLFCWGSAQNAQLGNNNSTGTYSFPQPILTGTPGVAAEAAGSGDSCATRKDGTLECWGDNTYGTVGNNSSNTQRTPMPVNTDTDWAAVSMMGQAACATKTGGSLWCWGYNRYGQLGDGTVVLKSVPTHIGTDTDWATLGLGFDHACAIKTGKTLWCWGGNPRGQLGDGTVTQRNAPEQIGTATDWVSVSGGFAFACGIRGSGALYCWGANDSGQLGDGTGWSAAPVVVP